MTFAGDPKDQDPHLPCDARWKEFIDGKGIHSAMVFRFYGLSCKNQTPGYYHLRDHSMICSSHI
eukprot:6199412-Pleurochrysis_carterae.AAC.2